MHRLEVEMGRDSSVFHLPGFAEPSNSNASTSSTGSSILRHRPSPRVLASCTEDMVPWTVVEEAFSMSRDALAAKQRAAEFMKAEAERLQSERGLESEHWSRRATRAEIDSGSLLEQLESVMQAKRAIALDRAELGRGLSVLRAERELLCQQLRVDPCSANLCREVELALADARRAGMLEGQLRVLLRQRRQLRLELEVAREAHARHRATWQAREAALQSALAAAGVPEPPLPPAPDDSMHQQQLLVAMQAMSWPVRSQNTSSCSSDASGREASGAGICSSPRSSTLTTFSSLTLVAAHNSMMGTPEQPLSPSRLGICREILKDECGGEEDCGLAAAAAARRAVPPPRLRRAFSVDAGRDAAMEQAGLEAVLERIALAAPSPTSTHASNDLVCEGCEEEDEGSCNGQYYERGSRDASTATLGAGWPVVGVDSLTAAAATAAAAAMVGVAAAAEVAPVAVKAPVGVAAAGAALPEAGQGSDEPSSPVESDDSSSGSSRGRVGKAWQSNGLLLVHG